ncbi:DUF808 domain-containing protein [Alteromonas halophila]|uniref:Membrane protein n=1 Tax=Alteromonas halophila TaxID=516698 RepID=A0A918JGA3_9ALTE|nr:DUF808 domain-containing protein [Alteromonas halophila]GGW78591.1 membrane protein [Alteromonas halophila]
MAAANLLTLLDDIAMMMDDIATMSKVAAKKTAGVLGDDLALNANQVSGVSADRELPVVWAVAKGSLLNKVILVPSALLISAFMPVMIVVLLVIGGLYLCFEGAEKVLHRLLPHHSDEERQAQLKKLADGDVDIVAMEKEKIKGAIRTDFILSAEIIVISLGSVASAGLLTQLGVLSALSLVFTAGVYGLVAGLVKLDDAGLYLLKRSINSPSRRVLRMAGRTLLVAAPALMKVLALAGTIAMFLVGGGILTHNIDMIHHALAPVSDNIVLALLADAVIGFMAGAIIVAVVTLVQRLRRR